MPIFCDGKTPCAPKIINRKCLEFLLAIGNYSRLLRQEAHALSLPARPVARIARADSGHMDT